MGEMKKRWQRWCERGNEKKMTEMVWREWRLSRRVKIEHDDRTTVQTSTEGDEGHAASVERQKKKNQDINRERRRENFEGAGNGRRGLGVGGRGRRKGGRETGKDEEWVEAQETVMGDWGRDWQLECWEETGGRGQVAGGVDNEGRWGLVAGKVGGEEDRLSTLGGSPADCRWPAKAAKWALLLAAIAVGPRVFAILFYHICLTHLKSADASVVGYTKFAQYACISSYM